jgi:LuxR family transcriptional regulator, maltose regulon positive regulatory protein
MCETQQLRFAAADRYYSEGLHLAEQHVGSNSVAAALPASLIAQLRYEQGRVDEAEVMLIDRLSVVRAGAILECVLSAYLVLARIAAQRINLEWAHTLLEQAEDLANTRRWGRLGAAAVLERARLYLHEQRFTEGVACLDRLQCFVAEYPVSERCAWSDIHRYAALARGYVACTEKRFEHAISILSGLQQEAGAAENHYFALRVATLLSTVQFTANKSAAAFDSFGRMLNTAVSAGIYSTILDEGWEVGPLLIAFHERAARASSSRELIPYVTKLIAAWQSRYGSQPSQMARSALSESLSNREGEILKFITRGLSNKEIAQTLSIAPETVKSHVKHIFVKLGVEKRAQAVSRAQSLGFASTLN